MSDLRRFFAITISGSLYRVEFGPRKGIVLRKIALVGASGVVAGSEFRYDRSMVLGILFSYAGLVVYSSEDRSQSSSGAPPEKWRRWTAPIAALCLTKEDAEACLAEYSKRGLGYWNERWWPKSSEVLQAIGHNHPAFIPSPSLLEKVEIDSRLL